MALKNYSKEGELVFGVAHIFASFNDTFVHVTDLSGKETIARVTGKLLLFLRILAEVYSNFRSFRSQVE